MLNTVNARCNLCNSSGSTELFVKNRISIVRCNICGLVFAYLMPSKEEIALYYNKAEPHVEPKEDLFNDKNLYLDRFTDRIKKIESIVGSKGKLLDIGCALGYFLATAKKRGWEVSGIELSKFYTQKVRELGCEVSLGTLEDVKFEPSLFDIITMWHVLEHLQDPMATLKEAHRILKNNGLLVLETPNFASKSSRMLKEDWKYIRPPEHLYYFTEDTLKKMLEKVGFKIIKTETVSSGTGLGDFLIKSSSQKIKAVLISMLSRLSWIKAIFMRFKKSDDLILVYARK